MLLLKTDNTTQKKLINRDVIQRMSENYCGENISIRFLTKNEAVFINILTNYISILNVSFRFQIRSQLGVITKNVRSSFLVQWIPTNQKRKKVSYNISHINKR